MTENDHDLRDRFAALRRHEEAQAPEFTALPNSVRKPVRPRLKVTPIAAATCLVAIVVAGLLFKTPWQRPQPQPGKPVASILEWKPPTDFLLDTPGRQLLGTVPAIGAFQGDLITPTPHRRSPQVRKPALP